MASYDRADGGVLEASSPGDLPVWAAATADAMLRFDIAPPSPRRFSGWMTTRRAGTAAITTLSSSGHVLRRRPGTRDGGDLMLINLVTRGSGEVTQNGVRTRLRPGDVSLYYGPNELRFVCGPDYECLCLSAPLGAMPLGHRWWGDADRLVVRSDRALAQALSHALVSMQTASRMLDGAGLLRAVDDGIRYVGALLAGESGAADVHGLAERVDRFIDAHLRDPELDAASIAAAHHISTRRLYQLLAERGTTPAAEIRARRLAGARRTLLEPAHRRPTVTECAAMWGFASPSHFGALFKAAYGESPARYAAVRRL